MFLFPFLFLYPFVISHIAKIRNFLIPTNKNGKNLQRKRKIFCIMRYVRATRVPILKNCGGGCFRTFATFAPLQHICSQTERRIRRLRRPARRGVCVAIGDRIKKKIFVGMCVFGVIQKKKQPALKHKRVGCDSAEISSYSGSSTSMPPSIPETARTSALMRDT